MLTTRTCLIALLLAATPALAEDTPWSAGVGNTDKTAAKQLLDEGNALFVAKQFKEALDKYEQAAARWDHPAIRFNVVRCLIQLDRSVEASDQLARALRYGAAPFEPAIYDEALAFEKMLGNQIGNLELRCTQAGTRVTLDGQPAIAACPGTAAVRVRPGHHTVSGLAHGFLTRTIDVVSVGGAHDRVDVTLDPLTKAAKIERRWATWKPWLVFGGGLAVAGFGAGLHGLAVSAVNDYDRQVAVQCADLGCSPDVAPRAPGRTTDTVAIGMISVGAAAAATGAVLLYMNRARTVYPAELEHVGVAPAAGGAQLVVGGRF